MLRHFKFPEQIETFKSIHLDSSEQKTMPPLAPSANVGLRENQVHIGVYPGGPTLFWGVRERKSNTGGNREGLVNICVMYTIAAIKMAVCLVDIIDDDVSQNHCVSNCSSTETVASSNLSQHILTRIVVRKQDCRIVQFKHAAR